MVRVSGSQIASLFLFLRYGGFPCFAFFFSSFFFFYPSLASLVRELGYETRCGYLISRLPRGAAALRHRYLFISFSAADNLGSYSLVPLVARFGRALKSFRRSLLTHHPYLRGRAAASKSRASLLGGRPGAGKGFSQFPEKNRSVLRVLYNNDFGRKNTLAWYSLFCFCFQVMDNAPDQLHRSSISVKLSSHPTSRQ